MALSQYLFHFASALVISTVTR